MHRTPPGPHAAPSAADHTVLGTVELRRVGYWRYPVHELVQAGGVLATLGRMGWLGTYLGTGTPVELSDGTEWRIRSATIGGSVCPIVVDGERRKVAVGAAGVGNYGITGRDFGYVLNPGQRPRRTDAVWTVRRHEDEIGLVGRRPPWFVAAEPVHIGAVLLSFLLMRYGLPDEARPRLPSFHWR